MRAALLSLLALSACARGLTPDEQRFAHDLFGNSLDVKPIVVQTGLGLTPLPRSDPPDGADPGPLDATELPSGACDRVPSPRQGFQWPAGVVVWNQMFLKRDYYLPDMVEGYPASVPVPQVLLMTHELVHVWQWQNRARTNYDPATSGGESVASRDPYFYRPEVGREFLTYGFEQQAAMIEDYVCYTLFDPTAQRRTELRALIHPVLPLDRFDARLGR